MSGIILLQNNKMEKRNKNQQGGYNIVFNCTCTVNITFNNGMPEINADTPKPKAPEEQSPWNMLPPELRRYFYNKVNINRTTRDEMIFLSRYALATTSRPRR